MNSCAPIGSYAHTAAQSRKVASEVRTQRRRLRRCAAIMSPEEIGRRTARLSRQQRDLEEKAIAADLMAASVEQQRAVNAAIEWAPIEWPSRGMYFIRCNEFVKIGKSRDILKRISALQLANPYRLQLILVLPGSDREERELHERFATVRVSGEWFSLSDELRDFISDQRGSRQ